MVEWEAAVDALGANSAPAFTIDSEAMNRAVYYARMAAYISRRRSGGKHADAVKAQNQVARRVRQALGYTYADDKVTF